jgi:hypothetical protein
MISKLSNNIFYLIISQRLMNLMFFKRCLLTLVLAFSFIAFPLVSAAVYSAEPKEDSDVSAEPAAVEVQTKPASEDAQASSDISNFPAPDDSATFKKKKNEEGYVLNLRDLIEKSKKRIEQVNEKIDEQAQRSRNLQREEKAREYYEKAMRLMDEGNLGQAQELWQKAIKITEHPEMKNYVRESVVKGRKLESLMRDEESQRLRRLELERGYSVREVEEVYQNGVELYKQKKFLASKDEFDLVEEMFPDHKATRSYLMMIGQEIDQEQQVLIDEKMKEEAHSLRKEKEEWRQKVLRKEKNQDDAKQIQAETTYQEALRFYKARYFEKAKDKFKEVEWIVPDYKATVKYLSRIDKDIEKAQKRNAADMNGAGQSAQQQLQQRASQQKNIHEKELFARVNEEAQFVYDSAVTLFNKGMLEESRVKFLEVKSLVAGFKSTDKYLTKIDGKLLTSSRDDSFGLQSFAQQMRQSKKGGSLVSQEQLESFQREAEWAYADAVALYNNKTYPYAYEKFKQVSNLSPGFKDSQEYIQKLQKQLNISPETSTPFSISPSSRGDDSYIQQAIDGRSAQLSQEAEAKYVQALNFYNNGNYIEAKIKFIQVEAVYSNYKDAKSYLSQIDQNIQHGGMRSPFSVSVPAPAPESIVPVEENLSPKLKAKKAKQLYQQAIELFKKGKHQDSYEMFAEVNRLSPGYKSTQGYLKKLQPSATPVVETSTLAQGGEIFHQFQAEAEDLFQQAVALYETGRIAEAKEKFVQVDRLIPGYKTTGKYFQQIEKSLNLPAGSLATKATAHSSGTLNNSAEIVTQEKEKSVRVKNELIEEPKMKFNTDYSERVEVQRKKANKRLEKMRAQKDVVRKKSKKNFERQQSKINTELNKKRKLERQKLDASLSTVYGEALKLYSQGKFQEAQLKFLSIESMRPEYRSVRQYLRKLETMPVEGAEGVLLEEDAIYDVQPMEELEISSVEEPEHIESDAVDIKPVNEVKEALKDAVAVDTKLDGDNEDEVAEIVETKNDAGSSRKTNADLLQKKQYENERRLSEMRARFNEQQKQKKTFEKQFEYVSNLTKDHDYTGAKRELKKLEDKLNQSHIDATQKIFMKRQVDSQWQKIEAAKYQMDWQRNDLIKRREEDLIRQKVILERKKGEDISTLERKIQMEEEKIALEKQKEEDRIRRERTKKDKLAEKEAVLAGREERRSVDVQLSPGIDIENLDRQGLLSMQVDKKKELDQLYKIRQKEIESERVKVRKSFQENLDALYQKGVGSFRTGDDEQARKIFEEIDRMQPEYKSTKQFLGKLQTSNKAKEFFSEESAVPQKSSLMPKRASSSGVKPKDAAVSQALDIIEQNL